MIWRFDNEFFIAFVQKKKKILLNTEIFKLITYLIFLITTSLKLKIKPPTHAVLSTGFRSSPSAADVRQAEPDEGSSPGPVQRAQTAGTAAFLSALTDTVFSDSSTSPVPHHSKDMPAHQGLCNGLRLLGLQPFSQLWPTLCSVIPPLAQYRTRAKIHQLTRACATGSDCWDCSLSLSSDRLCVQWFLHWHIIPQHSKDPLASAVLCSSLTTPVYSLRWPCAVLQDLRIQCLYLLLQSRRTRCLAIFCNAETLWFQFCLSIVCAILAGREKGCWLGGWGLWLDCWLTIQERSHLGQSCACQSGKAPNACHLFIFKLNLDRIRKQICLFCNWFLQN